MRRRSILSAPTRVLLAGRSVRQDRCEDTRFPEPSEGEVVLRPFDNADFARHRGRSGRKGYSVVFYRRFTELGGSPLGRMTGKPEVMLSILRLGPQPFCDRGPLLSG